MTETQDGHVLWFVGRGETLAAVDAYLAAPSGGFRQLAAGTWGIGKTALLDEIRRRALEDGQSMVLHLRLSECSPWRPAAGAAAVSSTKALVRDFDEYCRLLTNLSVQGESYRHRALGDLGSTVAAAQRAASRGQEIVFSPTVKADGDIDAEGDIGSLHYSAGPDDAQLDARLLSEKAALTAAFAEALRRAGVESGLVVLVDDLETVWGTNLGGWVLDLVSDLEGVATLVTARIGDTVSASPSPVERLERFVLTPFSELEVREYLERRFGTPDDALVRQVLTFSDGLPEAVAIAGDVLAQRLVNGRSATLDGIAEAEWRETKGAQLFATIVRELPDGDTREILRKGRLARQLDDGLVCWLLTGRPLVRGTAGAARAAEVRSRLAAYSFIEAGTEEGSYRFHEFIRRLPAAGPELTSDLESAHATMAAYYRAEVERCTEEWEQTSSPYQALYYYEDRRWQALVREWLHHAVQQTDPAAHELARLDFARIFLEGFWWWGCYVKFPFCDRLLDDWDEAGGDPAWSHTLRVFLGAYPAGSEKATATTWPLVEQTMVSLRSDARLHSPSARLGTAGDDDRGMHTRRRVRALTSLFIGHSCRYRPERARMARSFFDDAIQWLATDKDQIGVAWARYDVAGLLLSLGDDEAELAWRDAARDMVECDEGDWELSANLHRVRSDLHWAAGNIDSSVDSSAAGLLRAYAFLFDPHAPDLYTIVFYEELFEHLGARLAAIAARGDQARARVAVRRAEARVARLWLDPKPPLDDATIDVALAGGSTQIAGALAPPPCEKDVPIDPTDERVTTGTLVVSVVGPELLAEDRDLLET